MIIPPRNPDNPGQAQKRSVLIIGLLVIIAGLAAMVGMQQDTDRLVRKHAEEICGKGNVKFIDGTQFECGQPEEPQ